MLAVCWLVLCAPAVLAGAGSVVLSSAAAGHALKGGKHSQLRITSANKNPQLGSFDLMLKSTERSSTADAAFAQWPYSIKLPQKQQW